MGLRLAWIRKNINKVLILAVYLLASFVLFYNLAWTDTSGNSIQKRTHTPGTTQSSPTNSTIEASTLSMER